MEPQNSAMVDVPLLKLAKVGNKREKRRGGLGMFGARGAGAGFSGAAGGAGGIFGGGMSLAKLLIILLVSGGISAGAWQIGNMMAANSAAAPKPANNKLFADKDAGKYADTSGVIKNENTIPNSLGYINNDGLTDEQRAAKKAADAEAASKAAADAQAKADADAKAKADADKAAAAQVPAAPPAAEPASGAMKNSLAGGKFGSLSSGFGGGGGGGGLSGGSGLSGGINGKFGAMNNLKGANGALSGFQSAGKPTMTSAKAASPSKSAMKGFAGSQLGNAFGASRSALASGANESAAAGAAAPFDNNPAQGSVISGPGVSAGQTTGAADSAGSPNSSGGGGSGPLDNGPTAACQANYAPDINSNCQPIAAPAMANAAPYQGLINAVQIILGIVMILALARMILKSLEVVPWVTAALIALDAIMAALGLAVLGMGIAIAAMHHGDFMIGGIIAVVGGFIVATSTIAAIGYTTPSMLLEPAATLIAGAVGEMAGQSAKASSMM